MSRNRKHKKGKGWYNDKPQHKLAGHGIPTKSKDSSRNGPDDEELKSHGWTKEDLKEKINYAIKYEDPGVFAKTFNKTSDTIHGLTSAVFNKGLAKGWLKVLKMYRQKTGSDKLLRFEKMATIASDLPRKVTATHEIDPNAVMNYEKDELENMSPEELKKEGILEERYWKKTEVLEEDD